MKVVTKKSRICGTIMLLYSVMILLTQVNGCSISNCLSCDTSNVSICKICNSGFKLTDSSKKCVISSSNTKSSNEAEEDLSFERIFIYYLILLACTLFMTIGLPICLINMIISFLKCTGDCRQKADNCPRLDKERKLGYKPFKSLDAYMSQDIYKTTAEGSSEDTTEEIKSPISIECKREVKI